MKLHPREENVRRAHLKLMECLMELKKDLTDGEFLRVVTDELTSEWHLTAKYMIREERHPGEPVKAGGLE